MTIPLLPGAPALTLLVALAADPPADDPRPREAKAACAAGRVDEGIAVLARLYAESNDLMWVFNQGRCYQQNGRSDEAIQRFREFLRKAGELPRDEVREDAVQAAHGHLASLEAEQRHTVEPAPRDPRVYYRVGGAGLGVLGRAGVATGIAFGIKTRNLQNSIEQDAMNAPVDGARIPAGRRYETWQWVGYGVGAGALTAAAIVFYLGEKRSQRDERQAMVVPLVEDGAAGAALWCRF